MEPGSQCRVHSCGSRFRYRFRVRSEKGFNSGLLDFPGVLRGSGSNTKLLQ